MPSFGRRSRENLESCHGKLIGVARELIKHYDFAVIEGHRSNERQAELLAQGRSKLGPGKSRHNQIPSRAFDLAPWNVADPHIDWDRREQWITFGHLVLGVGLGMGVVLRWGGDWDQDWSMQDQSFNDYPHFELRG